MTVNIMADPEIGSGERRLKDNRKRYSRVMTWLLLTGGLIGMMMGLALSIHWDTAEFHGSGYPAVVQWMAIAGVAMFVVAVTIGSWAYFRAIDELEYEANKSAGLIGINVYAMLFLCWWSLAKVEVTPAPDGEVIFLITMASAIAAFCWRRFR